MASAARAYGVGVERKLYRVARGTCYFPNCARAIMFDEGDQTVCDVEIAHIYGAERGSARYDEDMTDAERAAFPNLILLCSGHHKMVDRDEVTYRVEVLQEWKTDNEGDLAALAGASLTADTLAAVLEEIVGKLRPQREITVDLGCGVILPAGTGGFLASPDLATLERTAKYNPGWDRFPRVLVTSIRNIGTAAVEVEAVDFHFILGDPDAVPLLEGAVTGQDTFPEQNLPLPHRLADGSAMRWFTKFEHVETMIAVGELHGRDVPSIRSEVRLASGETVSSAPFALDSGAPAG